MQNNGYIFCCLWFSHFIFNNVETFKYIHRIILLEKFCYSCWNPRRKYRCNVGYLSVLIVNYYDSLWRRAINPSASHTRARSKTWARCRVIQRFGAMSHGESSPFEGLLRILGRTTLFRAETRPGEIASGEEIRRKRTMALRVWIDEFRSDENVTFHADETRISWITGRTY